MFLRDWLRYLVGEGSVDIEGRLFVSDDCASRIEKFVRRWCFTSEGKECFRKLLKCAAVKLQTQWRQVLSTWEGGTIAGRIHVIIADAVENLYFSDGGMDVVEKESVEFDKLLNTAKTGSMDLPGDVLSLVTMPVTVCLCVGQTGSGKSTITQRISSMDRDKFELIDGDLVVGDVDELGVKGANKLTFSLSGERNSTTWSRVWEAIMKGKVPLISHGGGTFVKFGRGSDAAVTCNIKARISQVFGVETNLVVIVMRNASNEKATSRNTVIQLKRGDFDSVVSDVYTDPTSEYMKKVYDNRSASGLWEMLKGKSREKFISDRSVASLKNSRAVRAILETSDNSFTVPFQVGGKDDWEASLYSSEGLDMVQRCMNPNIKQSGNFQQLRAVMIEQGVVDAVGRHITLRYNKSGFEFSSEEMQDLVDLLVDQEFIGQRYIMTLRPTESVSKISALSSTQFDGIDLVNSGKDVEIDAFDQCKTVSVVHVPAFSIGGAYSIECPHITENMGEFQVHDSVKIIQYFSTEGHRDALELKRSSKSSCVFDGPSNRAVYYEKFVDSKGGVHQRKVFVRANHAFIPNVRFKCVGVTVFGNEDDR